MSGICAVWRKQNPEKTQESLAAMCRGLSLDAVERAGWLADRDAGVGVSARFASQQVCRTPRVLLACDADLYNGAELLKEMGLPAGETDTAPLLAALYERMGTAFVEKLRGDFSILLWDVEQRLLLGATDCFAIHPLACYEDGRVLVVASSIQALLQTGEVPTEVDPRAVMNLLNFSVNLAPDTIFLKTKRLPPGTLLLASERRTECKPYWDMQYAVNETDNEAALARQLEVVVQDAVAAQCKSDSFGTLGAFLSGGTDSSTVVGMMSRLGRGRVKTFSIGFAEQPFNELEYARITARKFGAEHHEYLVGPQDCWDALPNMIRYFDEPFGNSSAVPTYFCAWLAAQNGVRYLLAGDGGDELFGGNERYLTEKLFGLYQEIPAGLRRTVVEPLLAAVPIKNGLVGMARKYIRRSNLPSPQRYFSYDFLLSHPLEEVFDSSFLESLNGYTVLEWPGRYYRQAPAKDHLNRLLYLDSRVTLADNDLLKVTRMSEMAGVKTRFPFLERAVAEFSGTIPPGLKVKGFEKRYLFKRAFRNLLPIDVIHKKKHGFGIPVATWMKTDRRMRDFSRDVLLSRQLAQRGYFRPGFIEDMFRRYQEDESTYYGDTLWTLLILELWHRQFVDEPARVSA